MKYMVCLMLIAIFPCAGFAQRANIRTNLLSDATTTINLGVEARLGECSTLDIPVSYNPWTFSNHKQFKLLIIQPEYRHWLCEAFRRNFLGVHIHGGQFNINHIEMPFGLWPELKDSNYQGEFFGAGLSWGYRWNPGVRWGIEFTLGAGYARVNYDKYPCVVCGQKIESGHKNYWGPTKVGLNLIFNIF